MSLSSNQLCAIDPVDRAAGKFQVTVHSDDGKQLAIFDCSSEPDALRLRTAIREHADQLRRVADYRDRVRQPGVRAALQRALDAGIGADGQFPSPADEAREALHGTTGGAA